MTTTTSAADKKLQAAIDAASATNAMFDALAAESAAVGRELAELKKLGKEINALIGHSLF